MGCMTIIECILNYTYFTSSSSLPCVHPLQSGIFPAFCLPSAVDQAPQQPGRSERSVYLGEEYVNNHMLSDITFMVEGRQFHAHRIALLASSEAFRAMFNGGYRVRTLWLLGCTSRCSCLCARWPSATGHEVDVWQALILLQFA